MRIGHLILGLLVTAILGLGGASNRSCYVKNESADRTTWTSHAAT